MLSSIFTPLEHRAPIPPWFLPSFLVVGIISCLFPPSLNLVRISLAAPIYCFLLLEAPKYTTGEVSLDFVCGIFMSAAVLKWLDFVVFHAPETDFWRVSDKVPEKKINGYAGDKMNGKPVAKEMNGTLQEGEKHTNKRVSPGPAAGWLEKLRWSISLWSTTRGIGWNWKVKNVPDGVHSGYPKLPFIRLCIHRALFSYLAVDFVHGVLAWWAQANDEAQHRPNLFTQPPLTRTAVAWLAAFETYNALQLPYYIFAALTTMLGICRPEQWPPLMGSFREHMWSVRQFWGKCWHSELRRTITSPGKLVIHVLRIPRNTLWSKYTQLYVSFLTSAICHHAGAYLIGRTAGGMYTLWLSQATIIMAEDLVIYLGKRLGVRDNGVLRLFGLAWVLFWFCLPPSFPTGASVVLHAGSADDPPPFGFSVSALFPYSSGCNNLWRVMADRAAVFIYVSKGLEVIEARTWDEALDSGPFLIAAYGFL